MMMAVLLWTRQVLNLCSHHRLVDHSYHRCLYYVSKMQTIRCMRTGGNLVQRNKVYFTVNDTTVACITKARTASVSNCLSWQIPLCRYMNSSTAAIGTDELYEWIEQQRVSIYEIPTQISDSDMEYMKMMSRSERRKYLRKLYRKEQKQMIEGDVKPKVDNLSKTKHNQFIQNKSSSFVLRTQLRTMQMYDKWRTAAAMKFGPEVVIDMMDEKYFSKTSMKSLINQVMYANAFNMAAKEPFHLHLVNFNENGQFVKEMERMRLSMDSLMVNVTSNNLLKQFSREKIMYICPDSRNRITSYDPHMVYVIPALCCETRDREAILAQVKKLGVAHGRPFVHGEFPNVTGLVSNLMTLKDSKDSDKVFIVNLDKIKVNVETKRMDSEFSFSRAKPLKSASRTKKKF